MTHLCEKELSFGETLASLGVFSRSILKTQTNKIAVKLSLMGNIFRNYSKKKKMVSVNGKEGIMIDCPMYAKLFPESENIFFIEKKPGIVFVSKEFCEEALKDLNNLEFQQIDAFLCSFQSMPVELAADFLNSKFGEKLIQIFSTNLKKENMTLEIQCKFISRFLKIREILTGLNPSTEFKKSALSTP